MDTVDYSDGTGALNAIRLYAPVMKIKDAERRRNFHSLVRNERRLNLNMWPPIVPCRLNCSSRTKVPTKCIRLFVFSFSHVVQLYCVNQNVSSIIHIYEHLIIGRHLSDRYQYQPQSILKECELSIHYKWYSAQIISQIGNMSY